MGGKIKACVEEEKTLSTISIPADRSAIREQKQYKVIKLQSIWSNFAAHDRWRWWERCMLTT